MTKDSSLYVCKVNLFDLNTIVLIPTKTVMIRLEFKKKYLLEKNSSQINYLLVWNSIHNTVCRIMWPGEHGGTNPEIK